MGTPILSVVIICLLYAYAGAQDAVFDYICDEGAKAVKCENMIRIDSAWYGSGKPQDCTNISEVCGCSVTKSLHKNCTGKSGCRVQALKASLQCDGNQQPGCSMDYTKHISFAYTCLKGLDLPKLEPCFGSPIVIKVTSGYISSWMTTQTGRGNTSCPWLIEAQPGQRVRLEWGLFGGGSDNPEDYFVINDNNDTSLSSTDLFYVSKGRNVVITIQTDANGKAKGTFVLKFNETAAIHGSIHTPMTENTSSFQHLPAVIGAVVGVVVIIIVIGLVIFFIHQKMPRSENISSPSNDSCYHASASIPCGNLPTATELQLPTTELAETILQPEYADPKDLSNSDRNLGVDPTYDIPVDARQIGPPYGPENPPPKPKRQPHLTPKLPASGT